MYYTLRALREKFHLTFLTVAPLSDGRLIRQKLLESCDEAIVLPSAYTRSAVTRLFHKLAGSLYALFTGLKFSNYLAGNVEFSTRRLEDALDGCKFDAALFEYWHAHNGAKWLGSRGIPTLLDMHDILWRSYARQLDHRAYLPGLLKDWMVKRYRSPRGDSLEGFRDAGGHQPGARRI